MKKILFIVEHLSTGGMPQYFLVLIKGLVKKGGYDIYIVQYCTPDLAEIYVVQKKQILDLISPDHFFSLGEDREEALFDVIEKVAPDIIHIQEVPEMWFSDQVSSRLYKSNRRYKIVETSHDSRFNVDDKAFIPDGFVFISDYFYDLYSKYNLPSIVAEYPIEYHPRPDRRYSLNQLKWDPSLKHILHVGLFTPGKNQTYLWKLAEALINEKIHFHFVGNQADNFVDYWKPLMDSKPSNCSVYGERDDVDRFYAAADLFVFPSLFEANPIVIKEAIGWDLKIMMFNLPSYKGKYNDHENISFLNGGIEEDSINMLRLLQ